MAVAKGIGGGFPMGACLATEEASEHMTPGTHGTTFGGNPLAMAVGNAVLDVVLEDGFLEHVQQMGLVLKQNLAELVDRLPECCEEVRGYGLLQGIKCKTPNAEIVAALRQHGLLVVPAGDNVIRFAPPLVIDADGLAEVKQVATEALQSYVQNASN